MALVNNETRNKMSKNDIEVITEIAACFDKARELTHHLDDPTYQVEVYDKVFLCQKDFIEEFIEYFDEFYHP